jgi:hypothetical protein
VRCGQLIALRRALFGTKSKRVGKAVSTVSSEAATWLSGPLGGVRMLAEAGESFHAHYLMLLCGVPEGLIIGGAR